MAKFVDGFVILVPKKNLKAYQTMSKKAGKVWMEYGALEYRECVGEDLDIEFGLPFTKLTKAKKDEVVIFSWIVYASKAQRNRTNKKVMADPRLHKACTGPMPFDIKKMSFGGFKAIVDLTR